MIRAALPGDLPAMTHVRVSVRENHLSIEGMAALGITEEKTAAAMRAGHYGSFVAEEDGAIVAFSMADRRDGSIFALFVLPGHEGKGHGKALLDACETDLKMQGFAEAKLSTGRGTRAADFYARRGWTNCGADAHDSSSIAFRKQLGAQAD